MRALNSGVGINVTVTRKGNADIFEVYKNGVLESSDSFHKNSDDAKALRELARKIIDTSAIAT